MSSRVGYALAVVLLLVGAVLRIVNFATLPAGLNNAEIMDIRISERVRQGSIEVFYDLGHTGREGLYHTMQAVVTAVVGNGTLGYRMLSLWLGMLTLAAVYALAQRLFGALVGVAALALLSSNMWMIILSRQVARETVLPLLIALLLLMLARTLSIYRIHSRLADNTAFALLGGLLGIGFYIHPDHFLIVLFCMIIIIFRLTAPQRLSRQTISYLLFSLLVMIIIAMPYLISSIRLPNLSGASRIFENYTLEGNPPFRALLDMLGGIFFMGDANAAHNLPGRPLIDLVSGLLVLIGLLMTIRHWRQGRYAILLIASLALLPTTFLTPQSPNFLTLTPLLPLLAMYFGLGVRTLYLSIIPRARPVLLLGGLALLVFNLYWVSSDLLVRWPAQPETEIAYHARVGRLASYLDQTAADMPTLICDSQRPLYAGDVFSSTNLMLLMRNRKDVDLHFADCGTGMVFIDGGSRQQVIMPDPETLNGMQPYLKAWMDRGTLSADMPTNSVILLEVAQPLADTVGRFTTTAPAGYAPDAPGGAGLAETPVRFGGNITFLGYERGSAAPFPPGGIVTTITYWRVDGAVPPDLRLFTHVLADPATAPAAQNDTISVDVRQLESRDVFIQIVFVPLPVAIPPGQYGISIGAYTAANNVRLPVMDGDQMRGDRLFLGQIEVQ